MRTKTYNVASYLFVVRVDKNNAKRAQDLIMDNDNIFEGISFIFQDKNIK
jgi:hypothetical protein